jgi:hypothetical protein
MMRWLRLLTLLVSACGDDAHVVPVQVQVPLVDLDLVKSLDLWVFDQVGRDGEPIRCDDLLTRQITAASQNVIVIARVKGSFQASLRVDSLPVGQQNRIFYVDMFDGDDGLGERIGSGCAQSQSIVGGKRTRVEIVVTTPPPALAPTR